MIEFLAGADNQSAVTSLINLFGSIVAAIANSLGVSVQFVKDHFAEYLLKYGLYHAVTVFVVWIAISVIICTLVICGVHIFVAYNKAEYHLTYMDDIENVKSIVIKACIALAVVVIIISGICTIGRYAVAPEIYSVNVVIDKLIPSSSK